MVDYPPLCESIETTVRRITDEKRLNVSDKYWQVIRSIDLEKSLFNQPDLFASNALLMSDRKLLIEKFREHAFTENHGGRLVRKMAEENGGRNKKIMLRHAEDEMRHGYLFLALLRDLGEQIEDSIFGPENYLGEYYEDIVAEWGQSLYQFMCFINAAEIRTIYHVVQIIHIASSFENSSMSRIREVFAAIYKDELFHIRYSTLLVASFIDEGEDPDVLIKAFNQANAQTAHTIKNMTHSYALPERFCSVV